MVYTPNIPVTGQSLGITRDPINSNFQRIDAVFGNNHVAFNALGEGKHKFLQMPEQASAPTVAANEAGFYCKVGASPAESNLFFRGESDGSEYQLTTAYSAANIALFGTFTAYSILLGYTFLGGWSFLPGGLILQYGRFGATNIQGNPPIPFPIPFPTAAFTVVASSGVNPQFFIIPNGLITTTQFQYTLTTLSGIPGNFSWYAIGN